MSDVVSLSKILSLLFFYVLDKSFDLKLIYSFLNRLEFLCLLELELAANRAILFLLHYAGSNVVY